MEAGASPSAGTGSPRPAGRRPQGCCSSSGASQGFALLRSRKESTPQPLSPGPHGEGEADVTCCLRCLHRQEDGAQTSDTSSSPPLGRSPASARVYPITKVTLFPPLEQRAEGLLVKNFPRLWAPLGLLC